MLISSIHSWENPGTERVVFPQLADGGRDPSRVVWAWSLQLYIGFVQTQVRGKKGTQDAEPGQALGIFKSFKSTEMGGKQQKDYSKGSLQNQTRLRGFRRWKLLLLGQLVPNPSLQAELNCKDIPIRRLGPNYAKFLAPSIQTWLTRETSPFSLKNASFFVIAYLSRYGPHPWLCPHTHWTKVPTLQLEQWRWSISWHSSHPLHEESWCSQGDFDLLQDQSPVPIRYSNVNVLFCI